MLALNETLFVEHKREFGGEAYQAAKSIGAFANTLGGWLLVGAQDGAPYGTQEVWAHAGGPNLVDVVRDLLRGVLDPLPAFEARRLDLDAGAIGLVRVYESSDTPHVHLASGAVFVREPAGDSDTSKPRRAGAGARSERTYVATAIRSQAQLVQLSERGRAAGIRVSALVAPDAQLPLIESELGLRASDMAAADPSKGGGIFVRLLPYTLPARFYGWSTTTFAAGALLRSAEELAGLAGLAQNWIRPHAAGVSVAIGQGHGKSRHTDGAGMNLGYEVRLVIDAIGIVGAAMILETPEEGRRTWIDADTIAENLIAPTIAAAAAVLRDGESLGRSRCQIDLVNLGAALMMQQTDGESPAWVPRTVDVAVPASREEILNAARLAAYAFARGSGAPMFDPPDGLH